jgi:hypothetical protein
MRRSKLNRLRTFAHHGKFNTLKFRRNQRRNTRTICALSTPTGSIPNCRRAATTILSINTLSVGGFLTMIYTHTSFSHNNSKGELKSGWIRWHTPTKHNKIQIDAAIHSTHPTKISHTRRRHANHANTKGQSIDKHIETDKKKSKQKWQPSKTHTTFDTNAQNRRGQNIQTLNTKSNPTNQRDTPSSTGNTAPQSRFRTRLASFSGLPYKTMKSKKGRGEGSSTKQPIIRVLFKNRIKTISPPIRLCLMRRVKCSSRRIWRRRRHRQIIIVPIKNSENELSRTTCIIKTIQIMFW